MYKYLFFIFYFVFFSYSVFAQDDTEEETSSVESFEKEELKKENDYLLFKQSFLEALRQKSIENYHKALESLAICDTIYPNNIAMLFEQAKNNYKLKQYNEAHHYCNKALDIEPDNFWIKALSRDIYEKEQNYSEAIILQKELYKIKKSEAQHLLKLLYKTKNKKEGIKLIAEIDKKAIPVLSINFFKRYFNSEKIVSPKKPLKKAISKEKGLYILQNDFNKNKDFKILQKILIKEYQSKQFSKLLDDSNLGLDLFPAQANVYLYNGYALDGLAKHQKAVNILETGLDYVFDDAILSKQFYLALIQAYQGLNNIEKVNYYKQLVQKLK